MAKCNGILGCGDFDPNVFGLNAQGQITLKSMLATNTQLVANDSSTIDFSTSGVDNHTLTGSVKVSVAAGNVITVNPDGIYATGGAGGTSDSLVNNANGTSTHTAVNGTITTFTDGLSAVATPNTVGCNTGFGLSKMVRSFSANLTNLVGSKTLDIVLDSAPEHYTISAGSETYNATTISLATAGIKTMTTHSIIVNNPSSCRIMQGIYNMENTFEVELDPFTAIRYRPIRNVNGGGFIVDAARFKINGAYLFDDYANHNINPMGISAGGSFSCVLTSTIEVITPQPGSNWYASSASIDYIFSTT